MNVHFHALVLDEVAAVLHLVVQRVNRLLERRGQGEGDTATEALDPWREEAPALAGLSAAAVQGVAALGRRAGSRPQRCGDPTNRAAPTTRARCHARACGFDLHAGLVVPEGQPDRLERLCRYVLRPPVTQDRLHLTPDGQVVLQLRHRGADGTTHLVFSPTAFLERLAALTLRPRINLILYYGVLAPRAAWRDRVVGPAPDAQQSGRPETSRAAGEPNGALWAALMKRAFGFDVLACPRCGGRLRLIALITQPAVIARILNHLGLPTERPATRAPPALAEPELPVFDR